MTAVAETIVDRVGAIDWAGVEASPDAQGFARLPAILDSVECDELAALYSVDARFRSRIDMSRFRFGVDLPRRQVGAGRVGRIECGLRCSPGFR